MEFWQFGIYWESALQHKPFFVLEKKMLCNNIYLAALIAACGAAKLDRTYLPPPSAASAGGSPGAIQTPLTKSSDQSQNIPPGGFVNEHEGVVVEATLAGTRASNKQSGLGGSRDSYGSMDSKVGDAAFRTTTSKPQYGNQYQLNGFKERDANQDADLSAFYQPPHVLKPGNVQIVRDYSSDVIKHHNDIGLDNYNYGFETNNGIKTSANGIAIDGVRAQGGFSYTGDDGKVYSVSYIADEAGFRPQGSHLPTPHPIPPEILKSLEQNAKDEAAGIFDDGSYDAKKYNVEGDYTQISEYNDRLLNKMRKKPGMNNKIAIKQNQSSFETSNYKEQFDFGYQTSKDKNINPDVSNFNSGNRMDMTHINTLSKYEQGSSTNNGFGSRNEYLPPKTVQSGYDFSTNRNKYSFSVSPHSPQSLQEQENFGKPNLAAMRPSSIGLSPGPISQGTFPLQISSIAPSDIKTQSVNSFGAGINRDSTLSSQPYNKPSRDKSGVNYTLSTNPSIIQQSTLSPDNDKPTSQNYFTKSFVSIPVFSSQSSQPSSQSQLLSTVNPLQFIHNTNGHLPTTQFNSMSSEHFNPSLNSVTQTQYTNKPSSNFVTYFSSVVPAKKLEITLTTPLEQTKSNEPSTPSDLIKSELLGVTNLPDSTVTDRQPSQFSSQSHQTKETLPNESTSTLSSNTASGFGISSSNIKPQTTSLHIDSAQTTQLLQNTPQVTQAIFLQHRPGDSEFASTTQRPTYHTQSNQFTGQAQDADHSYIYNRPSVPFQTPVTIHQSNSLPSEPLLNHFDRVTQSMTTPLDSTISTKYQSQYPATITTFSPSFTTIKENDYSKNIFQSSNEITQASISKFPPIFPTVSSNFEKPSSLLELKPLQQSEFNTPSLSKFTNNAATVTATTLVQSTVLDNTAQTQLEVNTGTEKHTNEQKNEIYEYNKPSEGLSSETEKGGDDSSQKTYRPHFTTSSTHFSQENPATISVGEKNTQISYNYKPSEFFPSTMSSNTFVAENQDIQSYTTNTLSQKTMTNDGLQTGTQFVNSDSKETTPDFQQPYQQTGTQFDYMPPTSIPGLLQTKPETTRYTSMPEKFSTQLLTNQPTQFETQSNTQFGEDSFGNSATTPTQYQQSVTQFDSKPSTINMHQSQFNAQNTGKQNEFSTSFVHSTTEPTQFSVQTNTQEYQETFDTKGTTTSQFQRPCQQFSTTLNEPSISITSMTQTETPPRTTQIGEIYDYTKPTQDLMTPSQNNAQLSKEKPHFVNHIDTPFSPQIIPIFQQQKQEPQSNTQNIQTVNDQTVSYFTQPDSESSLQLNTGSTLLPSTQQDQTTFTRLVSDQTSTNGEIYEYTKPTQGLLTTQNVNNGQMNNVKPLYATHINTSLDPQIVPIFQREKLTQFEQQTQQSNSTSGPITENYDKAHEKETTVPQFTLTEQVTNTIYNTDSTSQDQNTDQASTTGEIYEYTKPEQGLPSEKETVPMSKEILMPSGIQTTRSDQDNGSNETPIDQSTQAPTSKISVSQTESDQNSQNKNTLTPQFTQGFESDKEIFGSRPQFAFHSACCNKFKGQNNDGPESSNPLNENSIKPNFGTNIIEQNKNIIIQLDKKENQTETSINLVPEPGFQDFDPRKGSQTYAGIGENFGGPRKPPSFDETGYHY
ncbi:unnamed protein product [Euphydryas editha]|uniref:Uncharacterized protein n=1 Tax=Euphydryas editha TaxID=104508 RepID=A0AAU9TX91_EUPED|nr:unnamed protein product [Euphydryas editha]